MILGSEEEAKTLSILDIPLTELAQTAQDSTDNTSSEELLKNKNSQSTERSIKSETENKEGGSCSILRTSLHFNNSDKFGIEVSSTGLRVPITKKGKWTEFSGGPLVIDQYFFDRIVANFENKVLGFEPPLYKGHDYIYAIEEPPAHGFIKSVYQVEDVLWAEIENVNAETYDQVSKGFYRYASAEWFRYGVDRRTGADVGPLLLALVLTNQPFITDLPRAETMSLHSLTSTYKKIASLSANNNDCTPILVNSIIPLSISKGAENSNENAIESSEEEKAKLTEKTKETMSIATPQESTVESTVTSTELERRTAELEKQLEILKQQAEVARLEAEQAKQALNQINATNIKAEIASLPVSAETQESLYKYVTGSNMNDEQQREMLSLVSVVAKDAQKTVQMTTQHGVSTATQNKSVEKGDVQPFQAIIERNQKLASQKLSR